MLKVRAQRYINDNARYLQFFDITRKSVDKPKQKKTLKSKRSPVNHFCSIKMI